MVWSRSIRLPLLFAVRLCVYSLGFATPPGGIEGVGRAWRSVEYVIPNTGACARDCFGSQLNHNFYST